MGLLVGGDASYHTPSFQLDLKLPSTARPLVGWVWNGAGSVGVGVYGTLLGPEGTSHLFPGLPRGWGWFVVSGDWPTRPPNQIDSIAGVVLVVGLV